jgi:hypothetical protein
VTPAVFARDAVFNAALLFTTPINSSKTNKTHSLNETFTPIHEETFPKQKGRILKSCGGVTLRHAICVECMYYLPQQKEKFVCIQTQKWKNGNPVLFLECLGNMSF